MSHKIALKIETQEDSCTAVASILEIQISQVSWSSSLIELDGILKMVLFSR